jgi:hypothetical protein
MGRSLGVANSTADIDGGTISGVSTLGTASGSSVGFYGTTPATQRASSVQAASVVSAQSFISVTSNLAAFCAEVAATLTGLGLWKGAA